MREYTTAHLQFRNGHSMEKNGKYLTASTSRRPLRHLNRNLSVSELLLKSKYFLADACGFRLPQRHAVLLHSCANQNNISFRKKFK